MTRRLFAGVLLIVGWLVADVVVAMADPPGPTDYQSEVTEIDPEVAGIDVEIVGGDSFVVLTVEAGVTVDVVGYSGEPYLRFLADGTVEENELSPSKYQNDDRYGAVEIPDAADAEAAPDWIVVGDDGSYAWHDHRTHWMASIRPPGKGPGDQVAEGVVPLFVDGVEVDVTVASVWQPPPSSTPLVLGLTMGVLVGAAALKRRGTMINAVLMAVAASTAATGTVAFFSTPLETGPPWSLWLLPSTALLAAFVAQVRRPTLTMGSYRTLQLLASTELLVWGGLHWSWLWASVLPTRLPFWADRFVGATTLAAVASAVVAVLIESVYPSRKVSFRP